MAAFTRTSSCGGLLDLDGVRILLDAYSQPVNGYVGTPADVAAWVVHFPISVACFSHAHPDHFSADFARRLKNTILLGPEEVADELPDRMVLPDEIQVRRVRVEPIPCRHQGIAGSEESHLSFVVTGSQCVWYMGDAAPSQWLKPVEELPHPDVLIAPFPYATTWAAWHVVEHIAPRLLILTHLPYRNRDPEELWPAVQALVAAHPNQLSVIPVLGAQVNFGLSRTGEFQYSVTGKPHSMGETSP